MRSSRTGEIIARVSPDVAAIRMDTVQRHEVTFDPEHMRRSEYVDILRAVCPVDEEIIYYDSLPGRLGWNCRGCGRVFEPTQGNGCANYYMIDEGDPRYTAAEWVAGWMNIDPDIVTVQIEDKSMLPF